MDANKPIDKNSSYIFVDVTLPFHVEAIWHCFMFSRLHVVLDVRAIFADMVDVW